MNDYGSIGYDQYLNRINSIPNRGIGSIVSALDFDTGYEIQTRNLRISNLIQNSAIGTGSGGPFGTGVSLSVSTTISANAPVFGVPFIAIYSGTAAVAGSQIYPRYGTGINNSLYNINSGFDYQSWNGTNAIYRVNIENNSGTTLNVFILAQWKILNTNARGTQI